MSLHETLAVVWDWPHSWDQQMVSMTATRLEQLDTLLMNTSTNVHLPTGYNHPRGAGQLSAYLPGNGGY